jgi:hypothetical protein
LARPAWATDFNDMAKLHGLDEVNTRIRLDLIALEEAQERKQAAEPPPATHEYFGLPSRDSTAFSDDALAEMNAIHATVSVAGKFRVMTYAPHPLYPLQRVPTFSPKTDFINHVVEPKIAVKEKNELGERTVLKPCGKWWIEHRQRRQFDDIDFVPGAPATITVDDVGS